MRVAANKIAVFVIAAASLARPGLAQRNPSAALSSAATPKAGAQDETRRAQVQAATANAASKLREQVLRSPLARDEGVRNLLTKTSTADLLSQTFQSAQQVGAPRWIDDQTCQVRLELSGAQLTEILSREVAAHPDASPLSAEALQIRLRDWRQASFSAVGSSADAASIESARPRYAGGWAGVDESTRRKAITAAREDAVHHVVEVISPIPLAPSITVKDAMARPVIGNRVTGFLSQQPVTKLEFNDDLNVAVTLAVAPRPLAGALRLAVSSDRDFASGASIDWNRVQQDLAAAVGPTIGTSVATGTPTSLPVTVLPLAPPDSFDQQIEAEAVVSGTGSRLLVARTAEIAATARLREALLALHIDATRTLGAAARNDPQLRAAVDRTMLHARAFKVDYRADGSVLVRVSLDLRNAWDDLRSAN